MIEEKIIFSRILFRTCQWVVLFLPDGLPNDKDSAVPVVFVVWEICTYLWKSTGKCLQDESRSETAFVLARA